jgi:hypothetical protein
MLRRRKGGRKGERERGRKGERYEDMNDCEGKEYSMMQVQRIE